MKPVVEACDLSKHYGSGEAEERVLEKVSLRLSEGEACVLLGPSGSGKTTLLSILGCLLTPSGGELRLLGQPVDFSRASSLPEWRRTTLGFVFQHAQLLPFVPVLGNLHLVGRNAGLDEETLTKRVDALLEQLGLAAMKHKKPGALSGGQRQRVAIARALLHRPAVLLADEPTAALDWHTGQVVADMLVEQSRNSGAALLVVTHDTRLVPKFDRVFHMENGSLREVTTHSS
ncbi:MAG TPA: hemin ABC transporter ATP-binding protein [Verrucomicrobiales bacterium]|nr:hemin ABC transporter ATP-binding protein [Verrucomicrobiales bacterium]